MKRVLLILIAVLLSVAALSASNAVKAQQPVFITSFGQSADANTVKMLGQRLKLDQGYAINVKPSEIDWSVTKTLICVIGGSQKGLGQAGLDAPTEIARCKQLIADARAAGAKIIGMHIGGQDRLGPNSQNFNPFAAECDYVILRNDTGIPEYFKPLLDGAGVPYDIVAKTTEITDLMKEVFF